MATDKPVSKPASKPDNKSRKSAPKRRSGSNLTPRGFLMRWVAALFLVLATYNPTGHSYYHW
ncbi:MAG: hypothetical protein ACI9WU_004659, partial [Myxococcota bacterium]